MANGTPREAAFLVCLSEAYELAGRKVADTTILSAAREMAARIPCDDKDIKELFVTAREMDNIPTIKTLWKAWEVIINNRPPAPSNSLTYDAKAALIRRINVRETLRLLAYRLGRYADMCKAYETQKVGKDQYEYKNPGLKQHFDHEMLPFLEKVCGKWLGENPNMPWHPIQKFKGIDSNKEKAI